MCVCVCVCVCVHVPACVHACMCACVHEQRDGVDGRCSKVRMDSRERDNVLCVGRRQSMKSRGVAGRLNTIARHY